MSFEAHGLIEEGAQPAPLLFYASFDEPELQPDPAISRSKLVSRGQIEIRPIQSAGKLRQGRGVGEILRRDLNADNSLARKFFDLQAESLAYKRREVLRLTEKLVEPSPGEQHRKAFQLPHLVCVGAEGSLDARLESLQPLMAIVIRLPTPGRAPLLFPICKRGVDCLLQRRDARLALAKLTAERLQLSG